MRGLPHRTSWSASWPKMASAGRTSAARRSSSGSGLGSRNTAPPSSSSCGGRGRLGASCDWSRERFTMDEGLSRAVQETFLRLWRDGLIYNWVYVVNWCPRCRTALSDEEVTHQDLDGHLYHIRYPIVGSTEALVIATTRPETMIGGTAA